MEYKHLTCPCCHKEVDIPLHQYSRGFDFNYSILINSKKEFFDLVDQCPECGYVMLFDADCSDGMREFTHSQQYQNVLHNDSMETGLRKWVLQAILYEDAELYTDAGICYTKAYDYLELKNMTLKPVLIEKAASCFLLAADLYTSFCDTILAVDALRRDGEQEYAKRCLNAAKEMFTGEAVDLLTWKENLWLSLNERSKRYLEI